MNHRSAQRPHVVLLDSDPNVEHLLRRALTDCGISAPVTAHHDSADALVTIQSQLNGGRHAPAVLVIVDLKTTSSATRDFLADLAELPFRHHIVVAAFIRDDSSGVGGELLREAGADAVFCRQADYAGYVREIDAVWRLWVQKTGRNDM
ncbi:hypothetical protein [Cucumibacter marinus]|uniref:hypothetical protein n=1 Tax=Cucumibacter marinus TaxID=1121252 RepID=UPI000563E7E6|nr:hypothetical protein [Cucumibacter marinus]